MIKKLGGIELSDIEVRKLCPPQIIANLKRAVIKISKNAMSLRSYAQKKVWQNRDPETNEKMVKVLLKMCRERPTGYEQKIIDLCKEHNLPFRYVGDGQVILAGRNPDFIETNGKKLIIETYSKYWKDKVCGGWESYERERKKLFAQYGYKILFLNDNDLLRKDWKVVCLSKIKTFLEQE